MNVQSTLAIGGLGDHGFNYLTFDFKTVYSEENCHIL